MEPINKTFLVHGNARDAFTAFTRRMNNWWPKAYTWSGEVLQEIGIEPVTDGMLTETGPHGFRCNWGRVIEVQETHIVFLWQIGPHREPVPDPEKASEVSVTFSNNGDSGCKVELLHRYFERHGKGSEDYRAAMDSGQGWDTIFKAFKEYINAGS